MNTASILIKTDPHLKSEAQKTAKEMGVSLTSVINRYLKHFITVKMVTYNTDEDKPSKYLINSMKKAKNDLKTGKASPSFDNISDAIAWLNR